MNWYEEEHKNNNKLFGVDHEEKPITTLKTHRGTENTVFLQSGKSRVHFKH